MYEQLVPYELAVKLKELGFDEECFYYADNDKNIKLSNYRPLCNTFALNLTNFILPIPFWQHAFDWFLEKHNFYSYIAESYYSNQKVYYEVFINGRKNIIDHETYHDARIACLEKLIDIVTITLQE